MSRKEFLQSLESMDKGVFPAMLVAYAKGHLTCEEVFTVIGNNLDKISESELLEFQSAFYGRDYYDPSGVKKPGSIEQYLKDNGIEDTQLSGKEIGNIMSLYRPLSRALAPLIDGSGKEFTREVVLKLMEEGQKLGVSKNAIDWQGYGLDKSDLSLLNKKRPPLKPEATNSSENKKSLEEEMNSMRRQMQQDGMAEEMIEKVMSEYFKSAVASNEGVKPTNLPGRGSQKVVG